MDKTREIIASMLKENTGTHFLDSGGAYGRHWERNQAREFEDEPHSILKFNVWNEGKDWDVELTHNVYHWLTEKLEYNKEWDNHFHEFANREDNKDRYWLECLDLYYNYLWELGYEISEKNSYNTYNGEDILSQTLQYVVFNVDYNTEVDEKTGLSSGVSLVFLQIHGGCDVRGGYTAPRAFEQLEEYAIYDNARGAIQCSHEHEHYWYTDDGYHFYGDSQFPDLNKFGVEQVDAGKILKKIKDLKALKNYLLEDQRTLPNQTPPSEEDFIFSDKILVDEDGNGYCPKCGGILVGAFN